MYDVIHNRVMCHELAISWGGGGPAGAEKDHRQIICLVLLFDDDLLISVNPSINREQTAGTGDERSHACNRQPPIHPHDRVVYG